MKLSPKQTAFVEEYLVDLNATQAAIRAKYSKKTASSQGERLLRNVEVASAIQKAKEKRAEETGIDAKYVLHQANKLLLMSLGEEPVKKVIKVDDTLVTQEVYEVDRAAAKGALEVLGKHVNVQAFNEKVDITSGGKPVKNEWQLHPTTSHKK